MARAPNEKVIKAKELFDKGYKLIEISKELNIPEGTIRSWKNRYKWAGSNSATLQKGNNKKRNVANKRGGQPGNKNSVGHKSSSPLQNKNAETHGFFTKHLPVETLEIIQDMGDDPSTILWQNIQIQYAAIVRAQNIMLVKSQEDMTKVLTGETNGDTSSSERYTIQFAWDKQASFLKAQSRAMSELRLLIKQFEVTASEEQKLKIDKMKAELNKISSGDGSKEDGEIKSMLEGVKNEL